jgi:hypothetical protein
MWPILCVTCLAWSQLQHLPSFLSIKERQMRRRKPHECRRCYRNHRHHRLDTDQGSHVPLRSLPGLPWPPGPRTGFYVTILEQVPTLRRSRRDRSFPAQPAPPRPRQASRQRAFHSLVADPRAGAKGGPLRPGIFHLLAGYRWCTAPSPLWCCQVSTVAPLVLLIAGSRGARRRAVRQLM